MKTLERVMRLMTHINIGATLGTAVWLLWSGLQVVSGQWTPALRGPAQTPPGLHRSGAPSCCFVPADGPSLQASAGQGLAPVALVLPRAPALDTAWVADTPVRMLARND